MGYAIFILLKSCKLIYTTEINFVERNGVLNLWPQKNMAQTTPF